MRQEYLLLDTSELEKLRVYEPEHATKAVVTLQETTITRVRFEQEGNNENTAKNLSQIHEYFSSNFNVLTLENGSAAYFNKRLYPQINDFECKLRKLLYFSSATRQDEQASKNITDLEHKDFGDLFTMLFVDISYMTKVKQSIKDRNKEAFTKEEIIKLVNSFDEETVWDSLLGKNIVPTLRTSFNEIREYRNDVMHSHNIGWSRYNKALKLYKSVNEEIDNVLATSVGEEALHVKDDFNETLGNAIYTYNAELSRAKEVVSKFLLQQQYDMSALREVLSNFQASMVVDTTGIQNLTRTLNSLDSMYNSEEFKKIKDALNSIYSNSFQISPELSKALENLKLLQVSSLQPGGIDLMNELAAAEATCEQK